MKSIFTAFALAALFALTISTSAFAVPMTETVNKTEITNMSVNEIINLTPQQYKEMTGDKLNITQIAALKYAQHKLKKSTSQDPMEDDKVLIYVLCFFIPPLAVAMVYDVGSEFWINVLLTLLCGVPGIIHAFIVCSKKFN